ncbi:MAG: hypothetical protein ABUT20_08195 [Bacteroidota bacterium]
MKKIYLLLIILLIIEFLLATLCGPYSCEWGNEVYFYGGILIAIVSFALPFFQKQWPVGKRIGFGLLFALGSAITWTIGFLVCDFKIICKLF